MPIHSQQYRVAISKIVPLRNINFNMGIYKNSDRFNMGIFKNSNRFKFRMNIFTIVIYWCAFIMTVGTVLGNTSYSQTTLWTNLNSDKLKTITEICTTDFTIAEDMTTFWKHIKILKQLGRNNNTIYKNY